MTPKTLLLALIAALYSVAAFGQEPADPSPSARSAGDTASSTLQIKGILISQSGRSTLINGSVLREGDRIGGVTILAIEENRVRVLADSNELDLPIGASIDSTIGGSGRQSSYQAASKVSVHKLDQANMEDIRANSRADNLPAAQSGNAEQHRIVRQGDTLSEIAQQYLQPGLTANQVMMALFAANPQAFKNNIHALKSGATLRIPEEHKIRTQSAKLAATNVLRQTERWQLRTQPDSIVVESDGALEYGPVQRGETLSAIAIRVKRSGVTMDQMMVALFQANQHAFKGNIHLLNEGAVLRLPNDSLLRNHSPELATAEVVHQTEAWRCNDAAVDCPRPG